MNRDVKAWISKAEGDYLAAIELLPSRRKSVYDAACFHAQQCTEKYLKGLLVAFGKPVPKIHDLRVLLELSLPRFPEWRLFGEDANLLTEYAVFFRYPGRWATRTLASDAIEACDRIRDAVRLALQLESRKRAKTAAGRSRVSRRGSTGKRNKT
jgi:HEPN domain-containing protein